MIRNTFFIDVTFGVVSDSLHQLYFGIIILENQVFFSVGLDSRRQGFYAADCFFDGPTSEAIRAHFAAYAKPGDLLISMQPMVTRTCEAFTSRIDIRVFEFKAGFFVWPGEGRIHVHTRKGTA